MSNVGATVIGGRYQVLDKIAEGGMGSVYKAQHTLSRKVVALKVIHEAGSRDEATQQRFMREVAAPAQIGHRGIVEIYDAGFDATTGALFVAMELLEGETLRNLLERGPVPKERAYSIFLRLLEPLAAAHAAGFVHRDLKPENVFLQRTSDGTELVKLLDFGITRHLRDGEDSVTQTGVAMGTPHYMSPEQAASARDVSYTTDVWAVGVMLYEALAGSPPFRGDTLASLVVDVLTRPHRSLLDVAPAVSPEVAAVVDRALDKAQDKRPWHAGALLAELRLALNRPEGGSGVHVLSPAITTPNLATTTPSRGSSHEATLKGSAPPTAQGIPVQQGPPMHGHGTRTPPPTHVDERGSTARPSSDGRPTAEGPGELTSGARLTPTFATPSVPGTVQTPTVPEAWQSPSRAGNAAPLHAPTAPSPAPAMTYAPPAGSGPPRRSRMALFVILGMSLGGVMLVGALMLFGVGAWLYANYGAQTVRGQLAFGDPVSITGQLYDSYDFAWTAGERVNLDATSPSFDPRVMIRAPSGRQFDDDPGLPGAHIEMVLDETGTYQVVVSSTGWGETGDYDLNVRAR